MSRHQHHKPVRGVQRKSWATASANGTDVLTVAVQHHQAGRLVQAEDLYRKILRTQPSQPDALHLLGLVSYQVGKHNEAIASIGKAIAIDPRAPAYHNSLGLALWAQKRLSDAAASLRRAVAMQPDFADAYNNLGCVLRDAGHREEAVDSFRQALVCNPDCAEAYGNLGISLGELGAHEEAVDSLRRTITLKPDYADAHSNLGLALGALGQEEAALESFQRALAFRPDSAEAHNNLGLALKTVGKRDEAEDSLRRAVALRPDFAEAHNNLGFLLREAGDRDAAIESFRRAAALKPDYVEAHANLGLALGERGDRVEAVESLQRAVALKPDSAEALNNLGLTLRNHGQLNEAAEALQHALALKPDLAEAHHNLGIVLGDQRELDAAVASFRRALALRPDYPEAHNNIGVALKSQGQLDEALENLGLAVTLAPDYAEAHNNLGCVLRERSQHDAAIECFRRAVAINADFAEAWSNLGLSLEEQGDHVPAAEHLRRVVALKPDSAEPLNNLGLALKNLGKLDEAAESLRKALVLDAEYAEAHNNLGIVLSEQGAYVEAEESVHRAIALRADYSDAYANLGVVLRNQERLDEALTSFRKAVDLKPESAEAHNNLAVMYGDLGDLDESLASLDRALRLQPEYGDGHFGLALVRLLRGELESGFAEYEWRWRCPTFKGGQRQFPQPMWDGGPLEGRTILLHAEQGLGDTLQFVRYAPLVAKRGGRVVLEVQPELLSLLRGLDGTEQVLARGETLPAFDVHAPLLSLPHLLGTNLKSIPSDVPYVRADTERAAAWAEYLRSSDAGAGLRVGLVWGGNPDHKGDRRRSLRLEALAALGQVPGVQFVALQKGPAASQTAAPPAGMELIDLGPLLGDFGDTAAVMDQLDLVITVDTSVAHLAGALGRPVWVLLSFAADWRWLQARADSPWYPTARLFRQTSPGDWSGVVSRLSGALHECATDTAVCPRRPAPEAHPTGPPTANLEVKPSTAAMYLALPVGSAHGWGICGKYLTKELSLLGNTRLVTDRLDPEAVGDELEYEFFKSVLYTGLTAPPDAPVLQCIGTGRDMLPTRPTLRGRFTAGYTFFEENKLPQTAIQNARRYFDVVVAGSTWCEEVLRAHGLSDVHTIIQGIDPTIFFPGGEKEFFRDRFVVFSGGKLELRKGQDLVIRAFKVLQDRHKDVMLVNSWFNPWEFSVRSLQSSPHIRFEPRTAGYTELISQLLADNGIDLDRVVTLPSRANATMSKIYRNTDVGLFPNRCEGGTNLVLMEYMACGRPAIASFSSGHKDIITDDNAMVIRNMRTAAIILDGHDLGTWDDPDLEETIERLEWAYQNRSRLAELGVRAGEDLGQLTWKRTAQLFHELLSTGFRGPSAAGPIVQAEAASEGVHSDTTVQAQLPATNNGHHEHNHAPDMVEMHRRILSEYVVGDDLPGADPLLLERLERSREYDTIRERLADRRPVDSWQQDGLHLFVLQLRPVDGVVSSGEPPTAVFTMHPERADPLSAVVVAPGPNGEAAEVVDLSEHSAAYTAAMPV